MKRYIKVEKTNRIIRIIDIKLDEIIYTENVFRHSREIWITRLEDGTEYRS